MNPEVLRMSRDDKRLIPGGAGLEDNASLGMVRSADGEGVSAVRCQGEVGDYDENSPGVPGTNSPATLHTKRIVTRVVRRLKDANAFLGIEGAVMT